MFYGQLSCLALILSGALTLAQTKRAYHRRLIVVYVASSLHNASPLFVAYYMPSLSGRRLVHVGPIGRYKYL